MELVSEGTQSVAGMVFEQLVKVFFNMICSTLTTVTVDVCNSLYNSKNEIQVAACNIAILIAAPPISVAYSFIPGFGFP
jgi:hypothetical protein